MAPKTTKAAAPKKATTASHASYKDMIKVAIVSLKDRTGSSRQAIKKYIQSNNNLGSTTDAAFASHFSQALTSGEKAGEFVRPKGPSGPVKLAKKGAAAPKASSPAATKKAPAAAKAAKAPKKAATTAKPKAKAAATKKPAAKKAAAPKKAAAAKPKANTAKPRKSAPKKAAAAPAVDSKPVVLGKTKSGRVTKNKAAPAKKAAAPKKAAPKKAAPKKAAA